MADGIRRAYEPLFKANEGAWELRGDPLKKLIAQVAGTDDDITNRIAATFSALGKVADFKKQASKPEETKPIKEEDDNGVVEIPSDGPAKNRVKGLRAEFQYVIQVQLPSNGTEETYLNIFNAIRKTFQ